MAQSPPNFATYLGFNATGDIGGLTCYTSRRGKTVWFSKSPPLQPPSYHQNVMRNRFRAIATAWNALQPGRRAAWSRAAKKARLRLPGYAVFVWHQIHRNNSVIHTIERLSHETLL